MADLLRKPVGASGQVHAITPEAAGWTHVGFDLWRLDPGEVAEGRLDGREAILVLVEGLAEVTAAGEAFGEMGDRLSVFDRLPPHCLYVPPGGEWRVRARTPCTLAVCTAPSPGGRTVQRLGPAGIAPEERGQGTNLRHIHNIAMEGRDVADSLLVTEVYTPAGHWSSYPPHRHDEDDFPRITRLEETYYHRLNPARGFGIQRVFTDDLSLDETMAVSDHDVVLVPRGHHPCAAPHGVEMYYLNVMAGPRRNWRFALHPDFRFLAT
ncbi:MAG: 5-deoxy-glucuronate isomerase [Rhodobacteraceae bacterium CG17_big_fil_post_rev_8_21_14_2_50_65_11]|nr:MAG: 5-deoxy-glucuronate isomerase [Rhodobacteraceae bacterium CG17_big_fil_post_rev_8_21_14_2_50_65_11]